MVVEYNTVKYCRLCKKRFVVTKNDKWKYYCDDCQAKINKKRKVSS
ncbi:MAG: hypothetical protein Q8N77_02920 [Nanoarchaeota archaeon]|nr:hypothetical protein [Nanoarchaeota archaeon]